MRIASLIAVVLLSAVHPAPAQPSLHYTIDCSHTESDSFRVTLRVTGFPLDSAFLVFPTTLPGTYEIVDAGRFVGGVVAYDGQGAALLADRISRNVFRIANARLLRRIDYRVADTFDSPPGERAVTLAEGTSLAHDHAVINPGLVCGFLRGFQSAPLSLTFRLPPEWQVETALQSTGGTYAAATYDELADCPVLLGLLSTYGFIHNTTRITVAAYSGSGMMDARTLADSLRPIIAAAERFIGELPVRRYTFLFYLNTRVDFSALEHRTSSFYVIPEDDPHMIMARVLYTAPHEFLHIITPLNLQSNLISPFSFETPVASRHLWFYEGVTEWGAWTMRVRSGLIGERFFLDGLREILRGAGRYDPHIGLVESSLGCYGIHADQWSNAFFRGTLAAMLLDMLLHDRSGGSLDLTTVLRTLMHEFGPDRPFSDAGFFDLLAARTLPEVREFLGMYVEGTAPLPVGAFLMNAGYDYTPVRATGEFEPATGSWRYSAEDAGFVVREADSTDPVNRELGIRDGDRLLKFVVEGREILPGGGRIDDACKAMTPGKHFTWVVERNGRPLHLTAAARRREIVVDHEITLRRDRSPAQEIVRQWWTGRHTPAMNPMGQGNK